ncbi:hypothetical protein Aph02nite_48470 [Actinoplanes philippinensis]|nr:hypothetical protein [Actinoplanes philippinensis]GIE78897.1 hypothetical protein Aph02nite_48470 [Actinoplanes philippinensis]
MTSIEDLIGYAREQGAAGYDIDEVRLCACAGCGGRVFGLRGDLARRAARRDCRGCAGTHVIAAGAGHFPDDEVTLLGCDCGSDDFNLAVGFALGERRDTVRALAVTSRCVECGRLGFWDDWLVPDAGTALLDLA